MTTATLPTTADEVVAEFISAHEAYPQYDGWLDGHRWEVRRVTRTIGGHGTFVRAEVGDLVLVRYHNYTGYISTLTPNYDSVYCPRVGWVVAERGDWVTEALDS